MNEKERRLKEERENDRELLKLRVESDSDVSCFFSILCTFSATKYFLIFIIEYVLSCAQT